MTDPADETASDGPPDPQLDPARSPGFGGDIDSLADIEVSRDDVTIGEATPTDLMAADTAPVADDDVSELLATLTDGAAAERRRATLALADRAPSDAVVDALAERARRDEDPDVRQFAVEALASQGADCLPTVARAALDDDDPWVRAEAVVTLDGHDRQAHADAIERQLDDDHEAVRRNALVSLAKHRGPAMLETLLSLAEDDSERVREWVAEFLGGIDDDRARAALATLTDDESDVVAEAAGHALADDHQRRELFTGSQAPGGLATQNGPPEL